MDYDFKPVLVKNIFTPEQMDTIYKYRFELAPEETKFIDPSNGYETCVFTLPKEITDRIEEVVNQVTPKRVKLDGNPHMPRYSLKTGHKPQLLPHYDVGVQYPAYTLSIQLRHSLKWNVFADDHEFDVEENDGVLFCGTHQAHWRPTVEFLEDDYYDIIVCQLIDAENPPLLDDSHREYMKQKVDAACRAYFT
jgi:hypothetical protein